MSQVVTQIWSELRNFFEYEDGSLPEIGLNNLNPASVSAVFEMLWERGQDATRGGAVFHYCGDSRPRSLVSGFEVATLVSNGRAEPPHVVLARITCGGVRIPDLGVTPYPDGIVLDYRSGTDWGPRQLASLLGLLCEIATIAPEMVVLHQEAGEAFSSAMRRYSETTGAI